MTRKSKRDLKRDLEELDPPERKSATFEVRCARDVRVDTPATPEDRGVTVRYRWDLATGGYAIDEIDTSAWIDIGEGPEL